jgi:hypothetical protein
MRLDVCEPGLSLSPVPAWVLAIDPLQMCWVNDAALEFWQAKDRAELFAREIVTGAPARVTARLDSAIVQVRATDIYFTQKMSISRRLLDIGRLKKP